MIKIKLVFILVFLQQGIEAQQIKKDTLSLFRNGRVEVHQPNSTIPKDYKHQVKRIKLKSGKNTKQKLTKKQMKYYRKRPYIFPNIK